MKGRLRSGRAGGAEVDAVVGRFVVVDGHSCDTTSLAVSFDVCQFGLHLKEGRTIEERQRRDRGETEERQRRNG